MAAKICFVLFVSAAVFECISAQCIGNALAAEELGLGVASLGYNPGFTNSLAYGAAPISAYGVTGFGANVAPTSGGGFTVTSMSPITPTGINVVSENAIEGSLSIVGEMPFLGAVALEGALPTAGAGGINYGCGNGAVGIVSEGIAPAPAAAAVAPGRFGYGPMGAPGFGAAGLGAGFGLNGFGAVY